MRTGQWKGIFRVFIHYLYFLVNAMPCAHETRDRNLDSAPGGNRVAIALHVCLCVCLSVTIL